MSSYLNTISHSVTNSINWVWKLIVFEVPWYQNYFYGLIAISLIVWFFELLFPWRKQQAAFRKDFWIDGFYMFFNFFIFSFFITGIYAVIEKLLRSMGMSMDSIALINLKTLPSWLSLLIFFVVMDFVQWFTHILLHRSNFLWQFHKVHHSVIEMGFAAHLRYHWMENVLYKPGKTIAIMLLGGFEPEQAFIVHFTAISIGHLNHSNINMDYGFLSYLFNNPRMHIWHHAKVLPPEFEKGANFGISLSIWDYLFNTSYIPHNGRDISLGFEEIETYPTGFFRQLIEPFKRRHRHQR